MSKEVKKHECFHCESIYKLLYDLNSTSGYPKFCPFCSAETYDDEDKFEGLEIDE
jgi:ribosome-associated toxin RatA of RatAB toxin-antitoxin module